jgi:hypothetical protein
LKDVANNIEVGGGDQRMELEALRQSLEARTEKLSDAYAKASNPSDEQASTLRDHVVALANLTNAIKDAVNQSRNNNESRVPQFDSFNGRGSDLGTVRFAGVDNPLNKTFDALDGKEVREMRAGELAKGASTLFNVGIESEDTRGFANNQPIGEGAGIRGEQHRSRADSVAANRIWANYDDGEVETRTVAQYAEQEVSDKDANAFKTKAELKAMAKQAAEQARQAELNGTAPKAPQKPVPADTWILSAYDKAGPILSALKAAGREDDYSIRGSAINAFTNQLIKESDSSVERRVIGYTADEVNAIALAIVAKLAPTV